MDELDESRLNQLAKFFFGIGKNKLAMKVEDYIKIHFAEGIRIKRDE